MIVSRTALVVLSIVTVHGYFEATTPVGPIMGV